MIIGKRIVIISEHRFLLYYFSKLYHVQIEMSTKKHFRLTESAVFLFDKCKVQQYQRTENDSIPAENLEIVLFYIVHEEFYYKD